MAIWEQVFNIAYMARTSDNIQNPPNRIREWRLLRGKTQAWVAEQIGTNGSVVARLETGKRPTDIRWLRAIAKALETDAGQLLNWHDNATSLNERERAVINAMRSCSSEATDAILAVAQCLSGYSKELRKP